MTVQSAYQAYQAGRLEEAERLIGRHLALAGADGTALQLGGMIALKLGDLPAALQRIQASLAHPTNRHEKLNTLGNIMKAAGDMIAAEQAFDAALQEKSHYNVARFNLAQLLFETHRHPEAAKQFEKVISSEPSHEMAWRGRVHALLEMQNIDAAETVLKRSPLGPSETRFIQASIDFYRNEFDRALGFLEESIEDRAIGGQALSFLLQILHMTGRWDEASDLTQKIMKNYPNRSDLWAAIIQSTYKSGDMDQAVSWLDDAPHGSATAIIELDILIKQKRFGEVREKAMAALQASPGDHALMQRLCYGALGTGEFDLAQNVADLGLRTNPNNQSYYAIKATAGRAKGQNYRYFFDYERFVRPFDLAAPEGWADMEAFNRDLKAELTELHGFEQAPLDQTLRLGTQTSPNLKFVDSPAIRAFFEAVDPAVKAYLREIGHDPNHAFLRRNRGGYRVRTAWSVRLGGGGHHVDHIHPEGWISSAYYVDVPDGSGKEGWIKFGEPAAPLNEALGQGPEHEVQPKAGRLVLFPSYLWHGTYPIADGKTRLTLPIDILPART